MYKYIFFSKILFLPSDTDSPLHYLIYSRSFITSLSTLEAQNWLSAKHAQAELKKEVLIKKNRVLRNNKPINCDKKCASFFFNLHSNRF